MECRYEEKNENQNQAKVEVEVIEKALRETSLRETKIDEVVPQRAEYIHTLEAQSSVESDVIAHNVMTLHTYLCLNLYIQHIYTKVTYLINTNIGL